MATLTQAEFKILWQFKSHRDDRQGDVTCLSTAQIKEAWKDDSRATANKALLSLMIKGLLTVYEPGSICLTSEGKSLVAVLDH